MMNRPPTIFVVLMALIITVSFNIPQVNINPVTTYNSYINSNNINNNHYSNANNHFTCNLPSAASGNTNVNINMLKPAQPSFDYYTLAQQWPPGVCKKEPHKCKRIPRRFTIHGLWPSNTIQLHPRECIKPSSFDFGKVSLPQFSLNFTIFFILFFYCERIKSQPLD
jgi:ribonuclease I